MGRKKKTREAPSPDPPRLAARGIDEGDPMGALNVLAESWGSEPDLEAWIVAKVGALSDDSAGAQLHALESRTTEKSVQREIKRALYRLHEHGHWETPAVPAPPSARDLLGPDENAPLGWLSPIDPTGTRLVWMARSTGGGMASLSAVINEDHGIREFHSGRTTKKALRDAHKEIAERSGIPLVASPWGWTHELLRRASDKTERGRFPDVSRVLATIAPDPPENPQAPIDGLIDRTAVADDEAALTEGAELLGEPEVGAWLLPLPWLEETVQKLADSESTLLVVSPAAQEERMRETLESAVDELLDPQDRRTRFADRLEESAFLFAKRGAQGRARNALAAAIATRAGKAISQIPVLAEITRRSLALALQARQSQKKEEEKSSLVVTPQQALAEQQRARRR